MRSRFVLILLLLLLRVTGICQKTDKHTTIYKPGHTFVYNAVLKTERETNVCSEIISLKILGGLKEGTNNQIRARWVYESYPNIDTSLTIGIQESDSYIFIHQPRYGKYLFSEVCGFPTARLPLYTGLISKTKTKIPKNSNAYGQFQGWKVKGKSKVKGKKIISYDGDNIYVWQIEKISKHRGGKSKAIFYYNEKYGFVYMKFISWKKDILEMNLVSIKK